MIVCGVWHYAVYCLLFIVYCLLFIVYCLLWHFLSLGISDFISLTDLLEATIEGKCVS